MPVCSTVREEYPSIPTQNEAYRVAEVQWAFGWIQEPWTNETEPFGPVTAKPAQFVEATSPAVCGPDWRNAYDGPPTGATTAVTAREPGRATRARTRPTVHKVRFIESSHGEVGTRGNRSRGMNPRGPAHRRGRRQDVPARSNRPRK